MQLDLVSFKMRSQIVVLGFLMQLCLGQQQKNTTLDLSQQNITLDQLPGLADIVLPSAVQTRVVGGEITTIEKVGGFLVALRYKGDFVCGGTLIEERIVISAAHCFLGRSNKHQWIIEGGISRLDEDGYKVQLQDYVTPAAFKEQSMNMDVAVLLLVKPLRGKNIATAALCTENLKEGLSLTVYGWGLSNPSGTSPHQNLRTVTVPVIKKSKCRQTYKSSMHISDSMFCAGVLGKKDACTFDSGGPIVYVPYQKPRQLCGIVSFGISCASPKYPGVYTDVNYIKPFIETTIKSFKSV